MGNTRRDELQTSIFWPGPQPLPYIGPVATNWYEDDDGFHHRRNGRFHHRRNLPHIARCINMIRQRNAQNEEVRLND
jgi:hypothetical protein